MDNSAPALIDESEESRAALSVMDNPAPILNDPEQAGAALSVVDSTATAHVIAHWRLTRKQLMRRSALAVRRASHKHQLMRRSALAEGPPASHTTLAEVKLRRRDVHHLALSEWPPAWHLTTGTGYFWSTALVIC